MSDSLGKSVTLSLLAHVALVLILILKSVYFGGEMVDYQSAVRVDLVGLPDKLPELPLTETTPPKEAAPEPPTPKPAEAAPTKSKPELPQKTVTPEPDTINLNKTKSKQMAAMDKLKQMSAFEKIQNSLEDEKPAPAGKPKLLKGNQVSSGNQLTGLTRLQAENYIGEVERKIRANWSIPNWLAQKNLKAQARVRYDETGALVSAQIVRSSGNPSFDDLVIETLKKSSPVPAPPEKLARLFATDGILFGFPE